MLQEPGSTVKHVNFLWPECMVGDGGGNSTSNNGGTGLDGTGTVGAENDAAANGNARGEYNVRVHVVLLHTLFFLLNISVVKANS